MRDISKFHWIKKISDTYYEMYLDHHMLSTFRSCQIHFQHLHVEGRRPNSGYSWSLEFGILMHKFVEKLYKMKVNNGEGDLFYESIAALAGSMWDDAEMDRFKDHLTCKSLGGKYGFISLCIQYVSYYTTDAERIRIIDTEISFGMNKEVPLGTIFVSNGAVRIDCYLSGRIDFLGDDGIRIGPVDHKTRASFGKKDLTSQYNPHEGMTGYLYATKKILETNFPELAAKRRTNTAWINFIQVANESDRTKRLRRAIVMRTDYQLEHFRLRQLETFKDIFNYLYEMREAQWNTEMCTHWYGSICMYQPSHRQADENSMLLVLNQDFTEGKFWNPEEIGDVDANGIPAEANGGSST